LEQGVLAAVEVALLLAEVLEWVLAALVPLGPGAYLVRWRLLLVFLV
jgi:hypothetical protein